MSQRIIGLVLACILAIASLAACSTPAATTDTQLAQSIAQADAGATSAIGTPAAASSSATAATLLADNTPPSASGAVATDLSSAVAITLAGSAITADGAGVTIEGSTATITAAGSYRISGALSDGQIVVDTDDEEPVQLILNGAMISSSTSAPLYIKQTQAAELILADGTQNALADGESYVYASADEDEPNAALFSDEDLTISGAGSLSVAASYNDGISSKDGLTIAGGVIAVSAADEGIRGKNYLIVTGGTLTVNAGGDGLKSDNADDATLGYVAIEGGSVNVTAGGDGVQAETDLVATGGDLSIVAGGGSGATLAEDLSAKGLKGRVSIAVDGGSFEISAADDGMHSDGDITLNGGTLRIASGDDGIHAEASVTVNGGDIQVSESYEGLEGAHIVLNSGAVAIASSDDGVNGAGGTAAEGGAAPAPGGRPGGGGSLTLAINGGSLVVEAAGDGIDVNGSITMSSGLVIVNGPVERMNGALDYDGSFSISGGTLVAAGSAGMAAAPDASSSQNALLLYLSAAQPAGTLVHIQDSAGNDILTFEPSKAYQSLAFSSPALASGETYQVFLGGRAAGDMSDGLYSAASYTPGAEQASFMVSSVVTQVGSGGGRFR